MTEDGKKDAVDKEEDCLASTDEQPGTQNV